MQLSHDEVLRIRALRAAGFGYREIARRHGIHTTTASRICRGLIGGPGGPIAPASLGNSPADRRRDLMFEAALNGLSWSQALMAARQSEPM